MNCEDAEDPEEVLHEEVTWNEVNYQEVNESWDIKTGEFTRDTEWLNSEEDTAPNCIKCGHRWYGRKEYFDYQKKMVDKINGY